MITVIKHGNKRRIVCPECNCIFMYEECDVKTTRSGPNEYDRTLDCPDCGSLIRFTGR